MTVLRLVYSLKSDALLIMLPRAMLLLCAGTLSLARGCCVHSVEEAHIDSETCASNGLM